MKKLYYTDASTKSVLANLQNLYDKLMEFAEQNDVHMLRYFYCEVGKTRKKMIKAMVLPDEIIFIFSAKNVPRKDVYNDKY